MYNIYTSTITTHKTLAIALANYQSTIGMAGLEIRIKWNNSGIKKRK